MEYQSLEEKIDEILHLTTLKTPEQNILLQTYLNPGISTDKLKKIVSETPDHLKPMLDQRLLVKKQDGKQSSLYPVPLVLLLEKYADQRKTKQIRELPALKSIDQWIKYPLMRSSQVKVKIAQDNDTVLRWLFDLHSTDWNKVYCFGDYESFIKGIGVDTEQDWINQRMKKQRTAAVVATQDGTWAQKIRKLSNQELRECVINPKDFEGLFIMAFPEIDTTVMGSATGEVTFVHSEKVAQMYAGLVQKELAGKK